MGNVHKEFLTFEQFKMVMTNLPDYVSESQAEEIFRIADRDGNGYIDAAELKKVTPAQLLVGILTPSPHSHDPLIPNNIQGCDVVNIMLLDTVTDR